MQPCVGVVERAVCAGLRKALCIDRFQFGPLAASDQQRLQGLRGIDRIGSELDPQLRRTCGLGQRAVAERDFGGTRCQTRVAGLTRHGVVRRPGRARFAALHGQISREQLKEDLWRELDLRQRAIVCGRRGGGRRGLDRLASRWGRRWRGLG